MVKGKESEEAGIEMGKDERGKEKRGKKEIT